MNILVIGASSGIGRHTVDAALARGHAVRAMARSAGRLPPGIAGLEPVAGDARDPAAVAGALTGIDAVVQTLGVGTGRGTLMHEVRLFSEATAVLLSAMRAAGVMRLVAVTGFGAGASSRALSLPERLGQRLLLGGAYADKDRQERLIEASDRDWTIVRPTLLADYAGSGRYRVFAEPERWHGGMIARSDVAAFIVDALERGTHLRRGVVVSR